MKKSIVRSNAPGSRVMLSTLSYELITPPSGPMRQCTDALLGVWGPHAAIAMNPIAPITIHLARTGAY